MKQQKETTMFLEVMGESPTTKILDYLLTFIMYDFTISEISIHANVSRVTTTKIMKKLLKQKIIKKTRKMCAATLYDLNRKDVKVKALEKLFEGLLFC